MKYKGIDLFAGIGGIRLGFENVFKNTLEICFTSEWDENACITYRENFNHDVIHGDITKVSVSEVPDHDILLAGFPCQAFSIAGAKLGFEDTRGTLFFDVARIVKEHMPEVVFCENVKGLTHHDKGRTFKVIVNTLTELGYVVYSKILNSKDFGVPQNRERIYIVAFRKDLESSSFEFPVGLVSSKKLIDIIEKDIVSTKYYISTQYLETLINHKKRHKEKGNGFGYEIKDLNGIANALVVGGMGRERNLIIDKRITDFTPVTHIRGEVNKQGIRKLTPREWARLQGFPDTFRFPVADTHAYKQLGNTVSVPVIEAIAKEIQKVLNDNRK